MYGAKIYFVLYIVLLCEIFAVLIDRDEAQQRNEIINGDGVDFAIELPDDSLSITIFQAERSTRRAESDSVKTVVLYNIWVEGDKVSPHVYWKKVPSGLDTNDFKIGLNKINNHYGIGIKYVGQKTINRSQKYFTYGILTIGLDIKRKNSSAGMKFPITNIGNERFVEKDSTRFKVEEDDMGEDLVLLTGEVNLYISFNSIYFLVDCDSW